MERAGITDPADVHYVQTKTPLLTLDTITDAKRRGHDVWTEDTLKSMDVSNSTTALGIAVALGEIEMPTAEQIHKDLSLFSSVASCSSGVELDQAQIVVLGNVRGVGWLEREPEFGHPRVGHPRRKQQHQPLRAWHEPLLAESCFDLRHYRPGPSRVPSSS
jgi:ring-opening amidohydrolase-like protein